MSSTSVEYITCAVPSCLRLLKLEADLAACLAWAKTGKRMAARIAMIAITTNNSMRVNAFFMMNALKDFPSEPGMIDYTNKLMLG